MAILQTIKKRNGEFVSFDQGKIERAINKAFLAVTREEKPSVAKHISDLVAKELELEAITREGYVPTVEHTQDLVEKHIMNAGFFEVAKHYIIYRFEHAKIRQEKKLEVLEKVEEGGLMITKRDGSSERFSLEKVRTSILHVVKGYEKEINVDQIVNQVKLEVYEGMPTREIRKALVMTIRSMIEQDPAYSYVASRMVLHAINEDLMGDALDYTKIDEQYKEMFIRGIEKGVSRGLLDVRMKNFDMQRLASSLVRSRDDLFMYLGSQTLYERYLVRDMEGDGAIIEHLQGFWMRVAMGIALAEKELDRTSRAIEFYESMSQLRFVPSSPTLFHAGTKHPQLSSCYLNTVGDSLESIFKVYGDNAQLSKWAGGIGTDWTSVRASGSLVKKSGIKSNGLVPFLKIANDVTVAINRSGRRRGATCVYIENWHYDIDEFLELRKNTGDDRRRTHDMDTALWISDLFMKRAQEDGEWSLFSPDEVPELHETYGKTFEEHYLRYEQIGKEGKLRVYKNVRARELWRKMVTMLYETGHPWITWKDASNVRSPQDHAGIVHNSNLCTEITLNNSEEETAVCNLGSLNYQRLLRDGKFDVDLVASTVRTAIRMLDNVIDVNYYPTIEAERSNLRHRPIGMGIMGFHDALYMMNINFDSDQAVQFADESMELISYHAILSSADLARERGTYSSFKGSKWDRGIFPVDTITLLEKERGVEIPVSKQSRMDWTPVREAVRQYGMRNSNTMAMAPTATISNIAGTVPCIEPIYKNIYVKSNMNGEFIIINPYLVTDLKALGLWDFEMIGQLKFNDGSVKDIPQIPVHLKDKYKEVFQIDPSWLIKSAAHRGKWVDQSQSLNIYFAGSSGRELANIYEYAWNLGLKTTYYLRSLGASQVEKSTVNAAEFGSTHKRSQGTTTTTEAMTSESPVPSSMSVGAPVAQVAAASVAEILQAPIPSIVPEMASVSHVVSQVEQVPAFVTMGAPVQTTTKYNITVMPDQHCDGCA
ncbi:MAG: Ribonucleoside-diphosphate reductase 1 subunit alpha [Candidatus Parcubacteria bacterium]|jgi:ribonucleoside-diphosphate reductase alpha chain